MPRIISGSGNTRPRLFICGERPGKTEWERGLAFVGDAGEELWDRLWRLCKIERSDCWVTNLIPTFSMEPPTRREIAKHAWRLREELHEIRPLVIATVGYHAARWFIPQYEDVNGDVFHGLPHITPRCKAAIVVPLVHSAAALRQADRYQEQFTRDVQALRLALRASTRDHAAALASCHAPTRPFVSQIGLASLLAPGQIVGLDTEGSIAQPEAISLAANVKEAACLEVWENRAPLPHVQTILDRSTIAVHYLKHDWKVLESLGLRPSITRAECTMLRASLLGEPQGLKTLASRLLGLAMSDYEDLVAPIDELRVRSVLEAVHGKWQRQADQHARTLKRLTQRHRVLARRARQTRIPAATRRRREEAAQEARQKVEAVKLRKGGGEIPRRAVSSLHRILTTPAEKVIRARWAASKFSPLAPLPPEPTWRDVDRPTRAEYSLVDAVAHREIERVLAQRCHEAGLDRIYQIDKRVIPFLVRNEQVGLKVDVAALARLSKVFAEQYDRTLAQLQQLAGRDVNPLSSEDISETIFDDWGVTPTRLTKTGFYTTQDKYLKARKGEHAGIPLVITCRQLNKYRGTYVDKLPSLLVDGRYHPDWKYTRTASGRAAEQIITLIPKHDPLAKVEGRENRAKAIRSCFVADDGCLLVSCDLSQIELRVFAHETRDPRMLDAFRRGEDLHARTAHDLLGAPKRKEDQDESRHRLPAKTLNFGILMGMTEWGLCDQLREQGQLQWMVSLEDEAERRAFNAHIPSGTPEFERACRRFLFELRSAGFQSTQEFRREWFKMYRVAGQWVEARKREAHDTGQTRDMWDRRFYLSGVWSTDERIRSEFERKAHALPIQSGAQGTAKRWIDRIFRHVVRPWQKRGQRCEPWVWVHDDVTLCVQKRIARQVSEEMLALVPQDLCIPVTADAKQGEDWGHLEAFGDRQNVA